MMMILFPPAVTLSPLRLLSAFCALAVPCCGQAATADGEIDQHERVMLETQGRRLHGVLAELLALSFAVYCRPEIDHGAR